MTDLEMRYRRLLRAYPAGHRADYEEEMVGVLMAGAAPGRRFPAPAEAMDLLRAGLTARLGRALPTRMRTSWRDAAAATGLVLVVMIACSALDSPVRYVTFVVEPLPAALAHVVLRLLLWVGTVVAMVWGRRRIAAGLAVGALLVEGGALLNVLAPDGFRAALRMSWSPLTVALAVGLVLLAVRGRPAREVVGRHGLLWLGAMTAASAWLAADTYGRWAPDSAEVVQLGIVAIPLIVLGRVAAGVRGPALVLYATALAAVFSWETPLASSLPMAAMGPRWEVALEIILTAGVPVAVFVGGALVLWVGAAFRRTAGRTS